jgi:ATP-dependent Clp protease ATP-binding subunit ClpA
MVIGQPQAMEAIVPYIQMYEAGLAPEGRPVGVFLMLGPTGTGKTRTVEALAEVLHGSAKSLLRIDCGEYQMDHEVAKLIGAPPGYLGHRETHPVLTQSKLAGITSEKSSISIVLFDEIEKAAPSMSRLLLGILDKASLRLGDNNVVNFERSLIFLTSNLGATSMMRSLEPGFGFAAKQESADTKALRRLDQIALQAARRQFAPEFMNRIDVTVTYQPLSEETLSAILDQQLTELQNHIERRLGPRSFRIVVTKDGRKFLLEKGSSLEYGARELKRSLQRYLTHPLAALVADGQATPGCCVRADINSGRQELELTIAA